MKSLDKKELKELLIKCWMTHDGMWFFHCLQEFGIEKTNKINKAAVRSMAMIEVKRIKKALGIEKIVTFEQLQNLVIGVYQVVKADFMNFNYSFPLNNVLHVEMQQCFAYDGIKRIGAINQYQCGIFDRIESWFDGLGIKYSVTPQVEGCMMHTDGNCFREYKFYFK